MHACGAARFDEFEKGVTDAEHDQAAIDVQDGRGPLGEGVPPEVDNLPAVVEAEPADEAVAGDARSGIGGEKSSARDAEGSCGEQKRREGDGRGQDRGKKDSQRSVPLYPVVDAAADLGGDMFFERGQPTFAAGVPGEIAANEGPGNGQGDEGDDMNGGGVGVYGDEQQEQISGAGDGQGNDG